MKFKVGDKVKIKSLKWYYSNSDCMGNIQCGDWYFTISQTSYCGKVLTISAICDDFYLMKDIGHHWTDEMIEGLADEPQEKMVSLDKVCKWLENINTDVYMDSGIFQMYDMIQDFRKAMEE